MWTKAHYGPAIASEQKLECQDRAKVCPMNRDKQNPTGRSLLIDAGRQDGENDARSCVIPGRGREANALEKYAPLIVVIE